MPFDGIGSISEERLRKIDAVSDLLASPDKWYKGALTSHDGRHCIRGAILAVGASGFLEPAVLQAINDVTGKRFRRIEAFNDHPDTEHGQVVTVLAQARANIAAMTPVAVRLARRPASPSWTGTVRSWFRGLRGAPTG
jgi:hypothetical protein